MNLELTVKICRCWLFDAPNIRYWVDEVHFVGSRPESYEHPAYKLKSILRHLPFESKEQAVTELQRLSDFNNVHLNGIFV